MTKRKDDSDGFEPTLAASTKDLGDRVEIKIRDNGAGIPPEVREKMFNPFFTTKPAGETRTPSTSPPPGTIMCDEATPSRC